jgi:hypothetical protein
MCNGARSIWWWDIPQCLFAFSFSFSLSLFIYYLYKYLMKKCIHAHLPLDGQLEDTNECIYICVYIRNQTPERNANIVVLSYRFNRDKAIERISKEILSFSHLFEHYDTFFLFVCVYVYLSFMKLHHSIDYWRNRNFINQSI